MDLVKLKTELTTDPLGRGYAGMTDDEAAATFRINDRQVNRDALDGGLLVSALVRSEYNALVANDKNYVQLIAGTATPIPLTPAFKAELGAIFPAGSATRTALLALVKRAGNRADELGLGGMPTASDVADAKRLP